MVSGKPTGSRVKEGGEWWMAGWAGFGVIAGQEYTPVHTHTQ